MGGEDERMTNYRTLTKEGRFPASFEGLAPPMKLEEYSWGRQAAVNFWNALEVGEGSDVLMVSIPLNFEVLSEARRRHANLTLVSLEDKDTSGAEGNLLRQPSKGKLARMVGDFASLDLPPKFDVVFLPGVIDDPRAENRGGMVRRAMELTSKGGFVAASFPFDEEDNRRFVDGVAAAAGYGHKYTGVLFYGGDRANVWRRAR
jgi:hypothetical protein